MAKKTLRKRSLKKRTLKKRTLKKRTLKRRTLKRSRRTIKRSINIKRSRNISGGVWWPFQSEDDKKTELWEKIDSQQKKLMHSGLMTRGEYFTERITQEALKNYTVEGLKNELIDYTEKYNRLQERNRSTRREKRRHQAEAAEFQPEAAENQAGIDSSVEAAAPIETGESSEPERVDEMEYTTVEKVYKVEGTKIGSDQYYNISWRTWTSDGLGPYNSIQREYTDFSGLDLKIIEALTEGPIKYYRQYMDDGKLELYLPTGSNPNPESIATALGDWLNNISNLTKQWSEIEEFRTKQWLKNINEAIDGLFLQYALPWIYGR